MLEKEIWIKPMELSDTSLLPELLDRVDKGKAEAIALAIGLSFHLFDELPPCKPSAMKNPKNRAWF
ncbi:MAG: hypothetical protein KF852_02895 [Saprospiraceae bacterium]|nr:hypothetical protein [Saprospiraceae bacterium]